MQTRAQEAAAYESAAATSGSSSSSSSSSSGVKLDIITIIKNEHRLVENLYKEYQQSSDNVFKLKTMRQIIHELSVHAACEEMILYPAVAKYVHEPQGKNLSSHALDEHAELKKVLYELDQIDDVTDSRCDSLLAQAMRDVMHHVGEEETQLLPSLAAVVQQQQLIDWGESFMNAKTVAPTRPHPGAPDKYPVNVAANVLTKPLDAVRDAMRGSAENKNTAATTTTSSNTSYDNQKISSSDINTNVNNTAIKSDM